MKGGYSPLYILEKSDEPIQLVRQFDLGGIDEEDEVETETNG